MAKAVNPTSFSRDHYFDPNFTKEITATMQVPKRIKVAGNGGDDLDDFAPSIPWQPEKMDMRVPDRILVSGQDGHIGTPAPPRETIIENSIMPPDPGMIRVQTPPRIITLNEHFFPSAADDFYEKDKLININSTVHNDNHGFRNAESKQDSFMINQSINQNDYSSVIRNDGTFLKTEEEIIHLRRQLVKMNRRVMNVEREILSKQQRDKIIFGMATAYFVIKIFVWLNRNS